MMQMESDHIKTEVNKKKFYYYSIYVFSMAFSVAAMYNLWEKDWKMLFVDLAFLFGCVEEIIARTENEIVNRELLKRIFGTLAIATLIISLSLMLIY